MKQSLFGPALFTLATVLSLIACKKDPEEVPDPSPVRYQLRQVKWSETDYLSFSYHDNGRVRQMHNQWQFLSGDPTQIRIVQDSFLYDDQNRLVQTFSTGGFYTKYYYNGGRLDRTEELYGGGAVLSENSYRYDGDRLSGQLRRLANGPGEPPTVYLFQFGYDVRGNLNKVEIFLQPDESTPEMPAELISTLSYSDFDDKINPASWLLCYPYLPQTIFQHNNPRKEVYQAAAGGNPQITTYEYEYDRNGLPLVQRKFKEGRVTTSAYHY